MTDPLKPIKADRHDPEYARRFCASLGVEDFKFTEKAITVEVPGDKKIEGDLIEVGGGPLEERPGFRLMWEGWWKGERYGGAIDITEDHNRLAQDRILAQHAVLTFEALIICGQRHDDAR